MHSFHLNQFEKDSLAKCPLCRTTKYLEINQGFGAAVHCTKCGLSAEWVNGFKFESERINGLCQWDYEMRQRGARKKAKRLLANAQKRASAGEGHDAR
jgi:hypothetical protein